MAGKSEAFYRIFFSHQQHRVCAKVKVGSDIGVMIGEGMSDKIQAKRPERTEKAGGIADTGNGVQPLSAQIRCRTTLLRIVQGVEAVVYVFECFAVVRPIGRRLQRVVIS